MPGLLHNITIEKGVDFQIEFIVTDPDTGLPFDFSGYTGIGQLLNNAGTKAADFAVALNSGSVLVQLSETATNIALGRDYTYWIDTTHPSQPDRRIGKGRATVKI